MTLVERLHAGMREIMERRGIGFWGHRVGPRLGLLDKAAATL